MPLVMRPARIEDADDIVHVMRTSRLAFLPYAGPVHSHAEDLHWARTQLIPPGGVTVAVLDDAIVGVLAVSQAARISRIDQLYVHPDHCGQGIGTQLLASIITALPRPIRLYTFQQNWRGRRFDERFGFRTIAFGDGSENEEQCPDVLYQLDDESVTSKV